MVHKQFYNVEVAEVRKTTPDCTVISLKITDELKSLFDFESGQHLTLKAVINGEEARRSYSLCSAPHENSWQVAIKRIDQGVFSTYVNEELKAGDTLEVMPPNGRFFVEKDPSKQKNYVAFAAGSGITPIISIIKSHLSAEPNATFTLFYVNRNVGSIILKEELEGLKNQYLERFNIFYFLTQEERDVPLLNGRIDESKLDIIFKVIINREEIDDYFICGPEAMIFLIRDYLQNKGTSEGSIHFELFNTSGKAIPKSEKVLEAARSNNQCDVTILEGGKTFKFSLLQGSQNILDTALANAADLPFACKGGVCCTCRAKLVEGEVEMAVNYALEKEEIEAGYILTCQSIPISDKVIVDFDH